MAAPSFVGVGGAVTSGTVPLPTGWAAGDLALLVAETQHNDTPISGWTPTGWTQITSKTTGDCGVTANTTSTRVTVWYRRLQAGDVGPTLPAPQNHVIAYIVAYRGVASTGDPWDVWVAGCEGTADTTLSATGPTTMVPDTRVVVIASSGADTAAAQFSGWSAPSLDGGTITERADAFTTAGNGGGVTVADGVKSAPGATGTISATLATSFAKAWIVVALAPAGISGAGAATLPAVRVSGAAVVPVSGSATVALPAVRGGGDGAALASGSATLAVPALAASGAGAVVTSGQGSCTLATVRASGSGGVGGVVSGSGSAMLSAVRTSGAVAAPVAGSGTCTPWAPRVLGAGAVSASGPGTFTLPGVRGAGSAAAPISGSGAVGLPWEHAVGTGASRISGPVMGTVPTARIGGDADVLIQGTVWVQLAPIRAFGSYESGRQGTGAIEAPALVARAGAHLVLSLREAREIWSRVAKREGPAWPRPAHARSPEASLFARWLDDEL